MEKEKSYQPERLSARHRALMRRLLAGISVGDAAEELGFSLSRASVVANSPMFKEEMEKMRGEVEGKFVEAEGSRVQSDIVRDRLLRMCPHALETLEGAMTDESGHVRVSAAKDILDRSGYAKEDKVRAKLSVEPSPGLIKLLGRMEKEKNDKSE